MVMCTTHVVLCTGQLRGPAYRLPGPRVPGPATQHHVRKRAYTLYILVLLSLKFFMFDFFPHFLK